MTHSVSNDKHGTIEYKENEVIISFENSELSEPNN